ncbi:hypothetical protein [Nocardia sp. NPDC050406]|uniref:hypothetical protein n=1 Tax=Nocardia sp. NPDC050406 TaxID=3364318 RepID=UPI00378B6CA4
MVVVVAAVSAVLWHFGSGLHPIHGLALLAPLPVLLLAPRVSVLLTLVTGMLSWLGGQAQMWRYFTGTLEQPVAFTAGLLVGSAVAFGLLILLFRALILRHRPGLAVLALPAGWVAVEYLVSLVGGTGAWWSIAYTQAEVLTFVQMASVTGVWGLTFLILFAPSVVAALVYIPWWQRLRIAAVALVLVVAGAAFGTWRLRDTDETSTVRVGLVAVSQPPDFVPIDSAEGQDMLTRAITEIERLADQGVRVVVLPEKAWRTTEATLPQLSGPLTEVAARRGIHVVAGLILARPGGTINAAIDYPSGVTYAKHYLIPGLEDEFVEGADYTLVPGEPWALSVCFDLDRPNLVRKNRGLGATLLLVPALDFTDDHWLHSRMAVVRGVESGMGIARAPQLGELVASDSRGNVIASARTDVTTTATVVADMPLISGRTVYSRLGDWFAGFAAGLFLIALGYSFTRRPAPAPETPPAHRIPSAAAR